MPSGEENADLIGFYLCRGDPGIKREKGRDFFPVFES